VAAVIYALCSLTCLACAILLLRGYKKSHVHLLLWAGLCFVGLTLSNVVLVLDRIVYPDIDLLLPRLWAALFGLLLLLFGLIWEKD
jgi:hypothetical protein